MFFQLVRRCVQTFAKQESGKRNAAASLKPSKGVSYASPERSRLDPPKSRSTLPSSLEASKGTAAGGQRKFLKDTHGNFGHKLERDFSRPKGKPSFTGGSKKSAPKDSHSFSRKHPSGMQSKTSDKYGRHNVSKPEEGAKVLESLGSARSDPYPSQHQGRTQSRSSNRRRGALKSDLARNAPFAAKKGPSCSPSSAYMDAVPARFRLNEASKLTLMNYEQTGRWDDLNLSEQLIRGLTSMGLPKPNAMQLSVIPALSQTQSRVLCAAETGSGKTLAFLIPLIEKLKREEQLFKDQLEKSQSEAATQLPTDRQQAVQELRVGNMPRAVILVPSNELIDQVHGVTKFLSHHVKLRVEKISAATPRSARQDALAGPIDIAISTPAQLLKSGLGLSQLRHLVMDEGDTLLSDDFGQEIREILGKIQMSRPTTTAASALELESIVVSSATIPITLTRLLDEVFPQMLRLGSPRLHTASERVDVRFVNVRQPGNVKLQSFEALLAKHYQKTTLIFCNTMAHACRLHQTVTENEELMATLASVPSLLHGSIPDRQRQSIINRFQSGDIRYLICTDLASRGLDTTQVGHVIMYDFARNTIDFIHRAGRTGRLEGSRGLVSCFISARDHTLARTIKQSIKEGKSFTSPK